MQTEMTGMLAPTPEPFEPTLGICWPADIPEERKAAMLADRNWMRYLASQPPHEQFRQISLWRPPVDPAVEARRQADQEAARERRAVEIAAMPNHEQLCRLFSSLEAKVIEQGVRIAELEDALANSKPAKVSRGIFRTTTTPPDAA